VLVPLCNTSVGVALRVPSELTAALADDPGVALWLGDALRLIEMLPETLTVDDKLCEDVWLSEVVPVAVTLGVPLRVPDKLGVNVTDSVTLGD